MCHIMTEVVLIKSHILANTQLKFPQPLHHPLSLFCLTAWLGNWISLVSQQSALSQLSGRSGVAGQHCVTANLSLDSSG